MSSLHHLCDIYLYVKSCLFSHGKEPISCLYHPILHRSAPCHISYSWLSSFSSLNIAKLCLLQWKLCLSFCISFCLHVFARLVPSSYTEISNLCLTEDLFGILTYSMMVIFLPVFLFAPWHTSLKLFSRKFYLIIIFCI